MSSTVEISEVYEDDVFEAQAVSNCIERDSHSDTKCGTLETGHSTNESGDDVAFYGKELEHREQQNKITECSTSDKTIMDSLDDSRIENILQSSELLENEKENFQDNLSDMHSVSYSFKDDEIHSIDGVKDENKYEFLVLGSENNNRGSERSRISSSEHEMSQGNLLDLSGHSKRPTCLKGLSLPVCNVQAKEILETDGESATPNVLDPAIKINSVAESQLQDYSFESLNSSSDIPSINFISPVNSDGNDLGSLCNMFPIPHDYLRSSSYLDSSSATRPNSNPTLSLPNSDNSGTSTTSEVTNKRPSSLSLSSAAQRVYDTKADRRGLGSTAAVPEGKSSSSGNEISGGRKPAESCRSVPEISVDFSNIVISDTLEVNSNVSLATTPVIEPLTPPVSNNIHVFVTDLGKVAPVWLPDSSAASCMRCASKFTFTRRRHHCRACGKIFCSVCCNVRVKLKYLEPKEGRVCSTCHEDLIKAKFYQPPTTAAYQRLSESPQMPGSRAVVHRSTDLKNLRQTTTSNVKQEQRRSEPSHLLPVTYSPAAMRNDLSTSDIESSSQAVCNIENNVNIDSAAGNYPKNELDGAKIHNGEVSVCVNTATPAIIASACEIENTSVLCNGSNNIDLIDGSQQETRDRVNGRASNSEENECVLNHSSDHIDEVINGLSGMEVSNGGDNLTQQFDDNDLDCLEIGETKNICIQSHFHVKVSKIMLSCCTQKVCWYFVTCGLSALGQDEVVILLQAENDDSAVLSCLSKKVLKYLHSLYDQVMEGQSFGPYDHFLFADDDAGEFVGFIFIRESYQCLDLLSLPVSPHLFTVLIHRLEVPWLHCLPLRLLLRLGAEFRYYPWPLVNTVDRQPVYSHVGHTVVSLLADTSNYKYRMSRVKGLTVSVTEFRNVITIPQHQHQKMKEILNDLEDEHVLGLEADFNMVADSHLVCMQINDGRYITEAINMQHQPRKWTGASFVVFNASLGKNISAQPSYKTKCRIIEDGLMIYLCEESFQKLKTSMRDMKNFELICDLDEIRIDGVKEVLDIRWSNEHCVLNKGIQSGVDGSSLEGVISRRIHTTPDFIGSELVIRWTESFYISGSVPRLVEEKIAQICCMSLVPHLESLRSEILKHSTESSETGTLRMWKVGQRIQVSNSEISTLLGYDGRNLSGSNTEELRTKLFTVLLNSLGNSLDSIFAFSSSPSEKGLLVKSKSSMKLKKIQKFTNKPLNVDTSVCRMGKAT